MAHSVSSTEQTLVLLRITPACVWPDRRWSGYYGEWGGLGEDEGYAGGAESEAYTNGGERKEAGFSTFHIRRGDFQYTRVSGVLLPEPNLDVATESCIPQHLCIAILVVSTQYLD